MTEAEWGQVRKFVCAGQKLAEVAEAFNVSQNTIRARSATEQWPTPNREDRRRRRLARECEKQQPDKVASSQEYPGKRNLGEAKNPPDLPDQSLSTPESDQNHHLAKLAQELLTVVRESPDRFDQSAGDFAQAMVAAGLAQVPAPRTISELAKWEQLRRQFKGLDQKGGQAGGLFDPFRPVRRATGNVVEAETPPPDDPMAGFEV